MTNTTPRVELFVDINSPNSPFFELDSDTLGLLDGDAVLAGPQWFNIADRATSISITRGRSNVFGFNSAGQLSVSLNNHDRAFDPTWTESALFGAVIPTIPVRVFMDDTLVYTGTVEDWDLSYTPGFDNIASFTALDVFADWSKLVLEEYQPASEKRTAGAIQEALTEVGVTQAAPDPQAGVIMTRAVVASGTNALQYVQKLATSDFGLLYIKADGSWDYSTLSTRATGVIKGRIGESTERPIHLASVQYGSENLYNKVRIKFKTEPAPPFGIDTRVEEITAENDDSVALYGERELQDTESLITSSAFGTFGLIKAAEVLEFYSEPELRIDAVELKLNDYTPEDKELMLSLEPADKLIVAFDPNNSGNKILRIVRVIGIEHSLSVQEHVLRLNFESSTTTTPFTLSDPDLGRLSAGNFLQKSYDFSSFGASGDGDDDGGFGI